MDTVLSSKRKKESAFKIVKNDIWNNKVLYLMVLPVLIYYVVFNYLPMYGVIVAFEIYKPALGVLHSSWVGFENFIDFFQSEFFFRILKNTLIISVETIVFGFPAPILLALLINEIRSKRFAKTVQTASYLPHFISIVVVCGMIKDFTSADGIIGQLYQFFGGESVAMLTNPGLFVPIYVISDIWQSVGWGSIIYIAALSGIDTELYEACAIDGGGRIRQTMSVTIPGIMPTIIIMFILRVGNILSVGFEKIILMYSPITYETADVISSFVYRKGIQEYNWGYSTAVGIFNSMINVALLVASNAICRRVSETSLW